MPFNHQMNSNLVDRNSMQAKRGIFRSKTHVPAPIRSKLSNNAVPIKPNRNKFQSEILNRRDVTMESDLKIELPPCLEGNETNVVQLPSVELVQDSCHSNVFGSNRFALEPSDQSLLLRVERCKLDRTTGSVCKKLSPILNCSANLGNDAISCVTSRVQTSVVDSTENPTIGSARENESDVSNENGSVSLSTTSLFGANGFNNQLISRKSNTFIKDDFENNSSKALMEVLVADNMEITNDTQTFTASTINDVKIGDFSQTLLDNGRVNLLENELKTYSESLKKYDQEAKDVIDKFTESLNEKGNIIRKYEEELSLFNSRINDLQTQLVESLERTKQMEPLAVNAAISHSAVDLKSENEKLKEFIKNLEVKLAKRDLHLHNLKEVLAIETHKIKELNKAQEEINQLQRDNIEKSREITILRDELKYAAKMRLELTSEYDEKIVKLKKLLAIREYLLIKGKS